MIAGCALVDLIAEIMNTKPNNASVKNDSRGIFIMQFDGIMDLIYSDVAQKNIWSQMVKQGNSKNFELRNYWQNKTHMLVVIGSQEWNTRWTHGIEFPTERSRCAGRLFSNLLRGAMMS